MCTTGYNSYKAYIATIKYLNASSCKYKIQERGKLFILVSCNILRNSQFSNSEYVIPNNAWAEIGKTIEKNKKNMSLSFGCLPINIQRHSVAFKAEHWLNWITLFNSIIAGQSSRTICLK
ncbi:hypothetical protein C2G38_2185438 [Gigaspora rosea]|uniref:Uncharacterized protein n=1 Tax=Gigaspora rosea TaxID=44941 RepID=A0A397V6S1_9GLOM|nr:hypothetical protein C2G38_2185438 [Gigaspora rosea]